MLLSHRDNGLVLCKNLSKFHKQNRKCNYVSTIKDQSFLIEPLFIQFLVYLTKCSEKEQHKADLEKTQEYIDLCQHI